jgi:hypothetical protein
MTTAVDTPEVTDADAFPAGDPPGSKTGDPDAPYGFTADNKPRAKPGRKPAAKATQRAAPAAKRTIPGLAKKPAQKSPPPPQKTAIDYGPAINSLLGQIISPMAVIGLAKGSPALIADAAAISNAAPVIAEGANLAAEQFPVVAAILDRVCKVGPYAGLVAGVTVMLGQIAVNHGAIPAGVIPGTMTPDALAKKFITDQAAADENFALMLQEIAKRTQSEPAPTA